MQRYRLLGLAVLLCAAVVGLADASIVGARRNPLLPALQKLKDERARLEAMATRPSANRKGRVAWYADRLAGGIDGARDMVRRMLAPESQERFVAEPRRSSRVAACSGTKHLQGRRIILDPGHGGSDPGAAGILLSGGKQVYRLLEKDLTLEISQRLAERLRACGAEVLLTRSNDETLDLFGRGAAGRVLETDLFMSIHFNYSVLSEPTVAGGRAVDGINYTTVYTYAPSRKNLVMPGYATLLSEKLRTGQPATSDRLAGLLFQRLSAALGLEENPPEGVRKNMRVEESRRAALQRARRKVVSMQPKQPVTPRFRDTTPAPSRDQLRLYEQFYARHPHLGLPKGVRRSDFVVLREIPDKPAVLVETSFIGDRGELSKLRTEARRRAIVEALEQGVGDYFRSSGVASIAQRAGGGGASRAGLPLSAASASDQ